MAPTQGASSFDDIIQAGRQRKKDELRAQQLLGRRSSTPQLANKPRFGSLASRISKPSHRSSSSSAISRTKSRGDDFRTKIQLPSRLGNGNNNGPSGGFTIRGLAGPYVVVGSNFAPGTSSDDIRSAVESVVGEFLSCQVITASPTVIAEMVFADKDAAEAVIAKYNNQKADGRLIHLYMKNGPPTTPVPTKSAPPMPRSAPVSKVAFSPMMPANGGQELGNKVSGRLAEPDIQDGRYGFGGRDEPIDVDVEEDRERNQPAVDSTRRDNRRFDDKRDDRREYGRDYPRDDRRDDYNRGYRRGGGYEARKLYSDDLYSSPQQRGRSFR